MGRRHAHGPSAGAPDCDVEWACGTVLSMKPIQVTFDEYLLAELDERPEVRERGRSAVLREATVAYLAKRRTEDIARQYEEAYTRAPQRAAEVAEWEGVQAWGEE